MFKNILLDATMQAKMFGDHCCFATWPNDKTFGSDKQILNVGQEMFDRLTRALGYRPIAEQS